MRAPFSKTFWTLLFGLSASAAAGESAPKTETETERNLELGGLVTLDHHARLEGDTDPVLDLGEVALGANVSLTGELLASVVIKSEHDLSEIFFDQAMAQVTPAGWAWTFLFGQQTLSHGLLSTRLISDPEILPYMEMNQPAVTAAYAFRELTAGAAAALLESEVGDAVSRDYAFVPYLDWNRGAVQTRLSGLFSRYRSDAGAAASAAWGPVRLDAEGFLRVPLWDGEDQTAGYLLGMEVVLGDRLSLAYRHDGISNVSGIGDAGRDGMIALRHGIGATFTLKQDLFAAAEYSDGRGGEAPGPRVALQVGLRSTLNLPGFQRATLTQDGKAAP